jgi:hypothetical protein
MLTGLVKVYIRDIHFRESTKTKASALHSISSHQGQETKLS